MFIPGGVFWRGCPIVYGLGLTCPETSFPGHEVFLSGYRIDRRPVTFDEYLKFLWSEHPKDNECGGPWPYGEDCIWGFLGGWTKKWMLFPDSGKTPEDPAIRVSWNGAVAYCEWAGRRMCTESEWEKAGKGGCDLNPDCPGSPIVPWGWFGDYLNTTGVGEMANRSVYHVEGMFDIWGRVEWVSDYWTLTVPPPPYDTTDPTGPPGPPYTGAGHTVKAGKPLHQRSKPGSNDTSIGFRCCSDSP